MAKFEVKRTKKAIDLYTSIEKMYHKCGALNSCRFKRNGDGFEFDCSNCNSHFELGFLSPQTEKAWHHHFYIKESNFEIIDENDLEPVTKLVTVTDGRSTYTKMLDLKGLDLVKYHIKDAEEITEFKEKTSAVTGARITIGGMSYNLNQLNPRKP